MHRFTRRSILGGSLAVPAAALLISPAWAAKSPVRITYRQLAPQGAVCVIEPSWATSRTRLPLAIYSHGLHGTTEDVMNRAKNPGQRHLIETFALSGYRVVVSDFGGDQWGNAASQKYVLDIIAVARRDGCRPRPVALLGASMGGGAVLSFAAQHPALVAAVAAFEPATDLAALKAAGYAVDDAYDGDYTDEQYGAEHSPLIQATGNTPGSSASAYGFDSLPLHIWSGSADTVVTPSSLRTFKARADQGHDSRVGLSFLTGETHSDHMIGVPADDAVRFIAKHLKPATRPR